jgi:hypothetical protein
MFVQALAVRFLAPVKVSFLVSNLCEYVEGQRAISPTHMLTGYFCFAYPAILIACRIDNPAFGMYKCIRPCINPGS